MINKVWVVFKLDKTVDDVTRLEVVYSDYCFALYNYNRFKTENEAEGFLEKEMKDYEKRGVTKDTRFVILPVYVFNNDDKFTI